MTVSSMAKVQARYPVDSRRVFVLGHSNGGYMSHRMACDHADLIAGIVSLAGAAYDDPPAGELPLPRCRPSEPVAVLEVHGMADGTVRYGSGRRRRDCHCADTPLFISTETPARGRGGVQQNDSLADGQGGGQPEHTPSARDTVASWAALNRCSRQAPAANGETVILLHPPLPLAGVSIGMERGCPQHDRTLAGGG